jgi:UDP-glucuronate decarboxylase
VYKPLPKDDPVRRKPDITLARETLGWQPKVKLEDGLPQVIEYFRPLSEKHAAPLKMPN